VIHSKIPKGFNHSAQRSCASGYAGQQVNRAASLTDDPALRDYLFKRAAANI
jgi:hypothetical protein